MSLAIRLILFAAVIGSAAWFGSAPGWGPSVTFLTALGGLLINEIRVSKHAVTPPPQRSQSPADRKLLDEFLVDFPDDGPLRYFANRTAANPFHHQKLFDLEASAMRWSGADREFLNPALEAARRHLMNGVFQFIHFVAMNTFPSGPELGEVSAHWPADQRDSTTEHIDSSAQTLYVQYQEFVRLARRVLLPSAPA